MKNSYQKNWNLIFVIPASLIWGSALLITFFDFFIVQNFNLKIISALIGGFLFISGVITRLYCRKHLGRHFTHRLTTFDDHLLITNGLYKYVRHPSYTADLVAQISITIFFSSFWGFLIMLLLIPCFLYRINIEEKMLIEKFGDLYREYQKSTKMLIPLFY